MEAKRPFGNEMKSLRWRASSSMGQTTASGALLLSITDHGPFVAIHSTATAACALLNFGEANLISMWKGNQSGRSWTSMCTHNLSKVKISQLVKSSPAVQCHFYMTDEISWFLTRPNWSPACTSPSGMRWNEENHNHVSQLYSTYHTRIICVLHITSHPTFPSLFNFFIVQLSLSFLATHECLWLQLKYCPQTTGTGTKQVAA